MTKDEEITYLLSKGNYLMATIHPADFMERMLLFYAELYDIPSAEIDRLIGALNSFRNEASDIIQQYKIKDETNG